VIGTDMSHVYYESVCGHCRQPLVPTLYDSETACRATCPECGPGVPMRYVRVTRFDHYRVERRFV
jgi:hypothetical protein